MKFARLFELENDEQVLLTVMYDTDNETHILTITSIFGGVSGEMKIEFNEKEDAITVMNDYTLDNAISFREKIGELITTSENNDVDDE